MWSAPKMHCPLVIAKYLPLTQRKMECLIAVCSMQQQHFLWSLQLLMVTQKLLWKCRTLEHPGVDEKTTEFPNHRFLPGNAEISRRSCRFTAAPAVPVHGIPASCRHPNLWPHFHTKICPKKEAILPRYFLPKEPCKHTCQNWLKRQKKQHVCVPQIDCKATNGAEQIIGVAI